MSSISLHLSTNSTSETQNPRRVTSIPSVSAGLANTSHKRASLYFCLATLKLWQISLQHCSTGLVCQKRLFTEWSHASLLPAPAPAPYPAPGKAHAPAPAPAPAPSQAPAGHDTTTPDQHCAAGEVCSVHYTAQCSLKCAV